MGTRADFYVGMGEGAEWLGSIAWDGYPEGQPARVAIADADSVDDYRARVAELEGNNDWTSPADGWPWPWDDSGTTDYSYTFHDGKVWCSCFGAEWQPMKRLQTEHKNGLPEAVPCVHPNMSARKNVTLGQRSGLIVLGA